MYLDRKEKSLFEENVHAKFLELYRRTRKEKRDKVFNGVGIHQQVDFSLSGGEDITRYFWLFNTRTGQTIDEMLDSEMVPKMIRTLAGEMLSIDKSRGDNHVTIASCLTRAASRSWDNFIPMMQRYGWEDATNLKIVKFEDPPSFEDWLRNGLNLVLGKS